MLTHSGEPLSVARAEEAIVTNFDKALGQDVLKEAADELLGGQGASSEFASVRGSVAEGHLRRMFWLRPLLKPNQTWRIAPSRSLS